MSQNMTLMSQNMTFPDIPSLILLWNSFCLYVIKIILINKTLNYEHTF